MEEWYLHLLSEVILQAKQTPLRLAFGIGRLVIPMAYKIRLESQWNGTVISSKSKWIAISASENSWAPFLEEKGHIELGRCSFVFICIDQQHLE